MISLRLHWGEAERVVADARIFDLRKRGIVPLAGKLQGPGVVHDMAAAIELDAATLSIRRIQPSMDAYPFAPGPATRGEGCPDRLPDVQRLVGASLRDAYATTLTETVGGPRGCFHIFTLLRLVGPTIVSVIEREEQKRAGNGRTPVAGSPLFSRSVIVDGLKGEGLSLVLRGMLFDLYYCPNADSLPLEQELEESFEAIADVEVGVPGMQITASAGRVRRSGPGDQGVGSWKPVATVGELVGQTMFKGYSAGVQERFSGQDHLLPLQHLLLALGPTLMQCFPSLAEELELHARRAEGPHAAVDSCHMWRADGPLVDGPVWQPGAGEENQEASVKSQKAKLGT